LHLVVVQAVPKLRNERKPLIRREASDFVMRELHRSSLAETECGDNGTKVGLRKCEGGKDVKRPADVDGRRLVVKQSKERVKRLRWFAVACRPELIRGLAGGEDIAGAQMELMVTDNADMNAANQLTFGKCFHFGHQSHAFHKFREQR
jgi:hypothetical protein